MVIQIKHIQVSLVSRTVLILGIRKRSLTCHSSQPFCSVLSFCLFLGGGLPGLSLQQLCLFSPFQYFYHILLFSSSYNAALASYALLFCAWLVLDMPCFLLCLRLSLSEESGISILSCCLEILTSPTLKKTSLLWLVSCTFGVLMFHYLSILCCDWLYPACHRLCQLFVCIRGGWESVDGPEGCCPVIRQCVHFRLPGAILCTPCHWCWRRLSPFVYSVSLIDFCPYWLWKCEHGHWVECLHAAGWKSLIVYMERVESVLAKYLLPHWHHGHFPRVCRQVFNPGGASQSVYMSSSTRDHVNTWLVLCVPGWKLPCKHASVWLSCFCLRFVVCYFNFPSICVPHPGLWSFPGLVHSNVLAQVCFAHTSSNYFWETKALLFY